MKNIHIKEECKKEDSHFVVSLMLEKLNDDFDSKLPKINFVKLADVNFEGNF